MNTIENIFYSSDYRTEKKKKTNQKKKSQNKYDLKIGKAHK